MLPRGTMYVLLVALSTPGWTSGCSDSKQQDKGKAAASLAELGVDDGASEGDSKEIEVTPDKDATLMLKTGAQVKIPKGAVSMKTRIEFARPADKDALKLIKTLDEKQTLISAPYVLKPHKTTFEKDVEVTLPIASGKKPSNLRVAWLEDENDTRWKLIGKPEIQADKATIKATHFSVFMLVDVEDGEDGGDAGGDSLGGSPGDVVFSSFPIDLADCPASGCTVRLQAMPYDGVFRSCDGPIDTATFDPATFDFAAACAERSPVTWETPFVYQNQSYDLDSQLEYCDDFSDERRFDANGRGAWVACDAGQTYVEPAGHYYGHILIDGVVYWYEVIPDDDYANVRVLEPTDTSDLFEQCQSVEPPRQRERCPEDIVLPFGPSGVGELPASLRGTDWIDCEARGTTNLAETCAWAVDPSEDTQDLIRFRPDGSYQKIYLVDRSYDYCHTPVGAVGSELRLALCDPDGYSYETFHATWEIRSLGGVNYLLLDDGDPEGPRVYVEPPASLAIPIDDDGPCAEVPVPSCILN
jgi:hypothetical protein